MFGKPKPKPKGQQSKGQSQAHNVTRSKVSSKQSSINGTSSQSSNVISDSTSGFYDSQCQQLMQMIQASFKELNQSSNSATPTTWPAVNAAYSAGMHEHFVGYLHSNTAPESQIWIIDSGATDHITPYVHLLSNVQTINSSLHLPNGHTAQVTHVGNINLTDNLKLDHVLCVPTFSYNLLSITKLT